MNRLKTDGVIHISYCQFCTIVRVAYVCNVLSYLKKEDTVFQLYSSESIVKYIYIYTSS